MYEVESENLSSLGGPMGTEHTTTNWRKYFLDLINAKSFCEKDYGKKIEWKRKGHNGACSGDLLYVMYNIRKIKIEDEK